MSDFSEQVSYTPQQAFNCPTSKLQELPVSHSSTSSRLALLSLRYIALQQIGNLDGRFPFNLHNQLCFPYCSRCETHHLLFINY